MQSRSKINSAIGSAATGSLGSLGSASRPNDPKAIGSDERFATLRHRQGSAQSDESDGNLSEFSSEADTPTSSLSDDGAASVGFLSRRSHGPTSSRSSHSRRGGAGSKCAPWVKVLVVVAALAGADSRNAVRSTRFSSSRTFPGQA